MTDSEMITRYYELQDLFKHNVKPKLQTFISTMTVNRSENLEADYLESLINESESYRDLCSLLVEMPNVVGHKLTDTKVGKALCDEVLKYKSSFVS